MNEHSIWPLRKAPQPNELFSTWLLRNARAHADTAYSYCKAVWDCSAFWTRDVDRCVSHAVLMDMAAHTGTPMVRAKQTSLRIEYGERLPGWRTHGITPWVLPLGVYHRTRTGYGIQFCPHCLAEDREPYFRLAWRLAVTFMCSKHGCRLLDRCSCGAPVIPHAAPDLQLALCHRCRQDLRKLTAVTMYCLKGLQENLLSGIALNRFDVHGATIPSDQYLHGLRVVVTALGRGGAARRLLDLYETGAARKLPLGSVPEITCVETRSHYLRIGAALLGKSPQAFLDCCLETGCTYNTFEGAVPPPYWLNRVLTALPLMRRQRRRRPRQIGRDLTRLSWISKMERLKEREEFPSFFNKRFGTTEAAELQIPGI